MEKIHGNQIDSLISAELPESTEERSIYDIVKTHMVYGPGSAMNSNSPCLKDNIFYKRHSKCFLEKTLSIDDVHASYRQILKMEDFKQCMEATGKLLIGRLSINLFPSGNI